MAKRGYEQKVSKAAAESRLGELRQLAKTKGLSLREAGEFDYLKDYLVVLAAFQAHADQNRGAA